MRTRHFILMALLALLAPGPALCATDTAYPANPYARLQYSLQNDLRLPVLTNFAIGNLPVTALFDLGAESLLVSDGLFARLGLSVQHQAESVSAGGVRYSTPGSVIALTAPGTNRRLNIDVMVNQALVAEAGVFNCVFPRTLCCTDNVFMFNSRGELYLFNAPCPTLPFSNRVTERIAGAAAVSIWETGAGMLVPVLIDGEHVVFFKLDTGASISSVNRAIADAFPAFLPSAGRNESVITSNGGVSRQRVLKVVAGIHLPTHGGSISLAGLEVLEDMSVPAQLPAAGSDEVWPNVMVPAGTLGMDFLSGYDLALNLDQLVMLLWDPAASPVLFK